MSSVQKPRTTRLAGNDTDSMFMVSDPGHILRNSTHSLFCTVYARLGPRRQDVQDHVETPARAIESEIEGLPPLPAHGQDSIPATPKSI